MQQFNPALAAQQMARFAPAPDITARANVPAFPFEKPAGKLQHEAARLHAELERYAEAHTARVADVRRAAEAVNDAKAALDTEIARGAREGRPDADAEGELALGLAKARATATPEVQEPRVQGAFDAYISSLDAFEKFMRANVAELVEGLRPEAERVAAAWQDAQTKARKLLDPAEAEHQRTRARVATITGYQRTFKRSLVPEGNVPLHPSHWATDELLSVPTEYGSPPIPTAEQVADYISRLTPPAAPVHPEEDIES
jgi:hypothetical protein